MFDRSWGAVVAHVVGAPAEPPGTSGKPYPWQRIGIPVEVVPACASLYGLAPVEREPVPQDCGLSPERPPTLR